ncbi:MAG: hypothetical protein GX537_09920 [Actinobacteria bacterium]|nr:hypothetical protein [Actinomycetota bacterium]
MTDPSHLAPQPGDPLRVVAAHRASYGNPISLRAGDRVIAGRRDTTWPEYLWCTGPDGREGWVPERFLSTEAGGVVAARDYDAAELTVEPGDLLGLIDQVGGWYLCAARDGRRGWVPAGCVQPAG